MTEKDIQDRIKNSQGLLLYFYTDNCTTCKNLRPKVETLMQDKFPKMDQLYVRSDNYLELCASMGVFSNPTLIAFFEGKEYMRWSKYVSTEEIRSSLERLYIMVFE